MGQFMCGDIQYVFFQKYPTDSQQHLEEAVLRRLYQQQPSSNYQAK